ncbi:RT0821/Lpp0805 family surface protein [Roseibium sp.]|uniref:RT0821/Lpp0805 family surface protein n=1 Tax=Roseibium sp. TaxID=1936156 RepID=UPI003D108378
MRRIRSYTAGDIKFQHLVPLLLVFAPLVSGCSQIEVPVGSNNVDTPTILTGSIQSSTDIAYSDISAEDRSAISRNLDVIAPNLDNGTVTATLTLPWLNPLSGNSGTLSDIDGTSLSETGCVSFRTTANTIAGIKLYSGTACRDVTQRFAVTGLAVADA